MICENKKCKWCKDGKCVLFAGKRILECKYRLPGYEKQKKTQKERKLSYGKNSNNDD